ncbi:MAG: 2-isopropylmalate synthase [Candidatus Peregrinibacteria bacterium]
MNADNNTVRIFDTTLRDGEQAPGFSMNLEEKLSLAKQLERLAVDVIEAGFPAASPDDFLAVKAIAESLTSPEVCGLARALESDIATTWEAIKNAKKPRIHTFIGTSPIHMEYKLKKTPAEILKMAENAVKYAKSLCDRVDFSPEDAGRSDRDFLVQVITVAIDAGADVINIPDTVGYTMPEEFGDLIAYLIKTVPNAEKAIFSTHCHNDLGLAVANSLAGVRMGARQVECTINGAGERAGNAALEEVVMAIHTRPDFYHLKTNIVTREIFGTSTLLTTLTGQKVQANKAIVGRNAFAHESGIHQHGILANRETYEIMTPESVGVEKTEIVLGKHSGRAALRAHLEKLGYELSDTELTGVFERFKKLADSKKEVTDRDLDVLVMGETEREEQYLWVLDSFTVSSGDSFLPMAKITLRNSQEKKKYTAEKTGSGMVDAAFQAIDEICGKHGRLTHFGIDAVTEGIDAQAIVHLRLEDENGRTFSARAGDLDIVKAAIKAYLSAVEKGYSDGINNVGAAIGVLLHCFALHHNCCSHSVPSSNSI